MESTSFPLVAWAVSPAFSKSAKTLRICLCSSRSSTMASVDMRLLLWVRLADTRVLVRYSSTCRHGRGAPCAPIQAWTKMRCARLVVPDPGSRAGEAAEQRSRGAAVVAADHLRRGRELCRGHDVVPGHATAARSADRDARGAGHPRLVACDRP